MLPEPFRLGHRPALDGLRGIAIGLVVLFHLGGVFWPMSGAWAFHGGFIGVDLFFALSGFLITAVLIGEFDTGHRIALPRFVLRRGLRLVPPLAVVIAVLLVAAVLDWVPGSARGMLEDALWTLAFAQVWPAKGHLLNPELGQTWSLAIEGQFYLVWGVAAAVGGALFPRRLFRPLLLAVAVVAALAVAIHRARSLGELLSFDLYLYSPYRLDSPMIGAIGGTVYASGWLDRVPRRWVGPAVAGGLAAFGIGAVLFELDRRWLYQGGFTAIALVGTVVTVGAAMLEEGRLADLLRSDPLVALGKASYSIFLWHMPVFVVVQREATSWPVWLQASVAVGIAAVLSTLSYVLVERPVLSRLRRRHTDPTRVVDLSDAAPASHRTIQVVHD